VTDKPTGEPRPDTSSAKPAPDKVTAGPSKKPDAVLGQQETPLVRQMTLREAALVLMTRSHQQTRMMKDMLETVSQIRRELGKYGKVADSLTDYATTTSHQATILTRIQTGLEEQVRAVAEITGHVESTEKLMRRILLVVQVLATISVLILVLLGYFLLQWPGG
jgi:hypothetical protein